MHGQSQWWCNQGISRAKHLCSTNSRDKPNIVFQVQRRKRWGSISSTFGVGLQKFTLRPLVHTGGAFEPTRGGIGALRCHICSYALIPVHSICLQYRQHPQTSGHRFFFKAPTSRILSSQMITTCHQMEGWCVFVCSVLMSAHGFKLKTKKCANAKLGRKHHLCSHRGLPLFWHEGSYVLIYKQTVSLWRKTLHGSSVWLWRSLCTSAADPPLISYFSHLVQCPYIQTQSAHMRWQLLSWKGKEKELGDLQSEGDAGYSFLCILWGSISHKVICLNGFNIRHLQQ